MLYINPPTKYNYIVYTLWSLLQLVYFLHSLYFVQLSLEYLFDNLVCTLTVCNVGGLPNFCEHNRFSYRNDVSSVILEIRFKCWHCHSNQMSPCY